MSIAVISPEASPDHVEVVIDTFSELMVVKDALGDYIVIHRDSKNPDEHRLEQAQILRAEMVDDVTETLSGEAPQVYRYPIEEEELVYDALRAAKQREEQLQQTQKVHYPEFDWLRDPKSTHPAAQNTRQNFYDF